MYKEEIADCIYLNGKIRWSLKFENSSHVLEVEDDEDYVVNLNVIKKDNMWENSSNSAHESDFSFEEPKLRK